MKRPDITPAQIVALAVTIVALATAFGAPITEAQATAIVAVVGSLAGVLVVGDSVIRNGRSRIAAAEVSAGRPPAGGDGPTPAGERVPPPAGAVAPDEDLAARITSVESQLTELLTARGQGGD